MTFRKATMKSPPSIFLISFFIGIIALSISCKKEQKLPAATNKGANTLGCYINGKPFSPNLGLSFGGSDRALYGGYTSGANTLSIDARNTVQEPKRSISITLHNPIGVGEYRLDDPNNICLYEEWPPSKRFSSAVTTKGKVVITRDDRINFILSGTFEFTATNVSDPNETVSITSGRFDISYQ